MNYKQPNKDQLSEEVFNQVYKIIETKQFKGQKYMTDQNFFRKLILFLKQLHVGQDTFRIIKMLIQHFGIYILPFLRPYYNKIKKQYNEYMKQNLQALALFAQNSIESATIHQVQFLYQYGISDNIVKKKNKDQNEKKFIQSIQNLSGFNKNLKDNSCNTKMIDSYMEYIEKLKKQSMYSMYELMVIDQIRIKQQKLQQIKKRFTQQRNKKQENSLIKKQKINKFSQITASTEKKSQSQFKQLPSIISEENSKESRSRSISFKKQFLCCRTYFFDNQQIKELEDVRNAFIHIRYPYNNLEIIKIKQIICSFLNSEGGILYIGILKQQNSKKSIIGGYYSQSQKQQVLKQFRKLAQTIQPDIITNKMYSIDFVPIREQKHPHNFNPGMYIVKVTVKYGIRDDIYSYRENETDYFVFRTQNELIQKEGRQLLKNLKQRIKNPIPLPTATHEGPCDKPLIGQQTHDIEGQKFLRMQKPLYQEKIQKPLKDKIIEKPKEGYKRILPGENVVHQVSRIQKQISQCYFYITGLNETQLTDILKRRSLYQGIKLQNISNRPKWFVLKSLKQDLNQSLRKLFKKIQQKYKKNGIKILQIKLGIIVNDIVQGKQLNKKHKIQYEIKDHNYFTYTSIKDSLTMFIGFQQQNLQPSFIDV